jgi:hypothetical protein
LKAIWVGFSHVIAPIDPTTSAIYLKAIESGIPLANISSAWIGPKKKIETEIEI